MHGCWVDSLPQLHVTSASNLPRSVATSNTAPHRPILSLTHSRYLTVPTTDITVIFTAMEPSSASVQPIHRLDCWNVLILDGPDVKAGFFQHNNHLTYTMIFNDLLLCYPKHTTRPNSLFLCYFSKLPGRPGWVFAGDAEADEPVVISSSGHTLYLIAYHETSCSVEDGVDLKAHYKGISNSLLYVCDRNLG